MDHFGAALRAFSHSMHGGYLLGFHSFIWNKKKRVFEFNNSRIRKAIFTAHLLISNAYIIFLGVRVIQICQNKTISTQSRFHMIYLFTMLIVLDAISIFGTCKNYSILHSILQADIDFMNKFLGKSAIYWLQLLT